MCAAALVAAVLAWQPSAGASPAVSAGPPAASSDADDPCDGLLALMDRPTVADSACSVKPGRLLTELGYQSGPIKGSGHLAFYPQASLRYGLPEGWELRLFPPNYNMSRASAGGSRVDGFGDAAFGTKYQLGTFGGVTIAADAKVTVPSGNSAFSSGGTQGNVQGIVSYNLTPKLGILFLLGASSLTSRAEDARVARVGSANASLVLGYQIDDRLQLFSEVFGNTKTSASQRGNVSYLGGAQFLLTKSIEIDIEAGTLLAGPKGVQARFFGVGAGLQF